MLSPSAVTAIVLSDETGENTTNLELAALTEEQTSLLVSNAFASTLLDPVIIVGGDTLNGNFASFDGPVSSPGNRISFETLNEWQNIGVGLAQSAVASRTDLSFDGSRNAVIAEQSNRIFGLDTGYTIIEGETFSLSYVWRDAFQWSDSSDQIVINLFTTDNDAITGNRTILSSQFSGVSTQNNTYETVDQSLFYTASDQDAGKILFVEITTSDGNGAANGFARLDNFQLTSQVPEFSHFGFASALIAFIRAATRRRKTSMNG
ncbi:MAG: hypothetical protein AAF546_05090 [Verrucomicrobiota bacterium]